MKLIIILGLVFGPSIANAKSFQEVLANYKDKIIISPVKFKGYPVNAYYLSHGTAAGFICDIAGYRLATDFKIKEIDGDVIYPKPLGNGKYGFEVEYSKDRSVFESVTCVK